jgi:hypothetical protein
MVLIHEDCTFPVEVSKLVTACFQRIDGHTSIKELVSLLIDTLTSLMKDIETIKDKEGDRMQSFTSYVFWIEKVLQVLMMKVERVRCLCANLQFIPLHSMNAKNDKRKVLTPFDMKTQECESQDYEYIFKHFYEVHHTFSDMIGDEDKKVLDSVMLSNNPRADKIVEDLAAIIRRID